MCHFFCFIRILWNICPRQDSTSDTLQLGCIKLKTPNSFHATQFLIQLEKVQSLKLRCFSPVSRNVGKSYRLFSIAYVPFYYALYILDSIEHFGSTALERRQGLRSAAAANLSKNCIQTLGDLKSKKLFQMFIYTINRVTCIVWDDSNGKKLRGGSDEKRNQSSSYTQLKNPAVRNGFRNIFKVNIVEVKVGRNHETCCSSIFFIMVVTLKLMIGSYLCTLEDGRNSPKKSNLASTPFHPI